MTDSNKHNEIDANMSMAARFLAATMSWFRRPKIGKGAEEIVLHGSTQNSDGSPDSITIDHMKRAADEANK